MKKSINLLALFILVSVNVFTPISYAQSGEALETPESATTETFVEENQLPEEVETPEVSDTPEASGTPETPETPADTEAPEESKPEDNPFGTPAA